MGLDREAIGRRLASANGVAKALDEMVDELCAAFGAERMTVYVVDDDREHLTAILQSGLDTAGGTRYLRVPADPQRSVAGYALRVAGAVNILDAYDDAALGRFDPPVAFLRAVDAATGYRTRELLTAQLPGDDGQPIGVVQFINRRGSTPFPPSCSEDLVWLATLIGKALAAERSGAAGTSA